MSTLTLTPEMRIDEDDEPRLISVEFDLPAEGDFADEQNATVERERYDEQILAALVSP